MRYLLIASALGLSLCISSAQAQDIVEVTVHDFAGLEQAIKNANQQPSDTLTEIRIEGTLYIPANESAPLPTINRDVRITLGVFKAVDGDAAGLFIVGPSGSLTVEWTTFVDISDVSFGPVLFRNQGELVLRNVGFKSVTGRRFCTGKFCFPSETAIIHNTPTGTLTLNGVRFVDSGSSWEFGVGSSTSMNGILANEGTAELIRTQVYLSGNHWEEPLTNSGILNIRNSSFLVRNRSNFPWLPLLAATDGAVTESVNSVFEGFTGSWCDQVTSLGHNSSTASDCAWASPGDSPGAPIGLIWRAPLNNLFNLVPSAASPVVDSAENSSCAELERAFFDGNGDGTAACDRGAFELQPITLAEGGINGFYFNPEADGHYITVLQTDYTTLVVWNTFDAEGNHVWVYGTGELINGRSVIAKAYINRTGGFTPDGLVTDVEAEFWGELQVDMDSCLKGAMAFRSVIPEFGSGQFPLKRLAYVKQLGCIDPDTWD